MKAVLILISVCVSSTFCITHEHRFLVKGQSLPPALRLNSYASADYRLPEFEIDGNPIPVVDCRVMFLSLGGGVSFSRIPGTIDMHLPLEDPFFAYASLFGTGTLIPNWFWLSYHAYGIASDKFAYAFGAADSYLQVSVLGYRVSDRFLLGLGVVITVQEDVSVIPLPMISYSAGRWVITVSPTAELRATYKISQAVEAYAAAGMFQRSFYIQDRGTLGINRTVLRLGTMFKVYGYLFADGGISANTSGTVAWSDGSESETGKSIGVFGGLKVIVP